jgi:hypothetical protein
MRSPRWRPMMRPDRSSQKRLVRFLVQGAVLAVGMLGAVAMLVPVSAVAATATTARQAVAVSGQVLDARILSTPQGASVVIPTGLRPIAGAKVSVAFPSGTTVTAVTNRAGTFTVARPAGTPAKAAAIVSVSAAAFGTWRETGVPVALPHGNHPILTVLLKASAQSQAYPRSPMITGRPGLGSGNLAPARSASARAKPAHNSAANATSDGGCTGYFSNTQPPATIVVDNVTTGTIQTYAFEYYVENVLPNEWIASWPASSLEAGAMAVKTYGWYWVNNWRGGEINGTCYDVQGGTTSAGCDVNYQCFIPGSAVSATTDAVENTWGVVAQQSGAVFDATYNSGVVNGVTDTCGDDDGSPATGSEMSQYGTDACANGGLGWQQIFTTYYFPDVTFVSSSGPQLEVAFQANTGHLYLYDPATGGSSSVNLGIEVGTSPSIAVAPSGAFEVAFEASNTDDLWVYNSVTGLGTNSNLGMEMGTSPSIAVSASGAFEVAFESNTYELYTYNPQTNGHTDSNLGMEAGSSPSIASDGSGYEVAFESNTNNLYTYNPQTNGNTDSNLGMDPASSPSIASDGSGYEVAFEANTDNLYMYNPQTNGSTNVNLGMEPATGPSIASDGSGYEVAFQANTNNLYIYNPQTNGNIDSNLGMDIYSSPSIASNGSGYEVAFEANTDNLYTYNPQTNGSTNVNLGMEPATDPAIG